MPKYSSGVVTTQPTSQNITVVVTNGGDRGGSRREFSYGLCDCCGDIGACCQAIWCPCIVHYNAANAVGMSGCCWCWLSALLPFLVCCITCQIRGRMVPGNCCSDCMVSYFLPCCALTQLAREAKE